MLLGNCWSGQLRHEDPSYPGSDPTVQLEATFVPIPDLEERLDYLREVFVDGPAVTGGYAGLQLLVDGDEMVLVFRWRADPLTYAIRASLVEQDSDFFWDPHTWLMEELDTGMVRGSPRRLVDGRVELDWRERSTGRPTKWYVSAVPLDSPTVSGLQVRGRWIVARRVLRPGAFLGRHGLDTRGPVAALESGQLVSWLVLWSNEVPPRVLGHGATKLGAPSALRAELSTLQLWAEVERQAEAELISALLHDTAEMGCTEIVASGNRPTLALAGFTRAADGTWILATDDPTHLDW